MARGLYTLNGGVIRDQAGRIVALLLAPGQFFVPANVLRRQRARGTRGIALKHVHMMDRLAITGH